MTFDEIVSNRYSVRAFDPSRPVAPEDIAAMCEAAATPNAIVNSTIRGRHLRRGPCIAWATPMHVYTPPYTPSAASTSEPGPTHALSPAGEKQ